MPTKREDRLLETIQHFHPDSIMCAGWAHTVRRNNVVFLTRNFKNLRIFEEEGKILIERKKGKAGEFSPEHTILMLKFERDMYMHEEDRLRDGLRELLDD